MSNDIGADRTRDSSAAQRLAEVRRRLAALREGKPAGRQAGADKPGDISWPRNLNDEQTAPGEWGRDLEGAARE